jgi:mono/diheme cytochrome c family protein
VAPIDKSACGRACDTDAMHRIVRVMALLVVGCLYSSSTYAADAAPDARVQNGKRWYDTYCTPCHGPAGTPGSAVFAATKKPIDLRTFQQRNGGRFPTDKWWDVVFNPQPAAVHTAVWERIRGDQHDPAAAEREISAHNVVGNIEFYVMSIQSGTR